MKENNFRSQFKFYKQKNVSLDFSQIIDLNNFQYQRDIKNVITHNLVSMGEWEKSMGMNKSTEWNVYEITKRPGLIFIKNPFTSMGQRYWIARCLEYYTRKPNKLNIDDSGLIENFDNWWDYCQRQHSNQLKCIALKKLRWATFGYHHNWNTKEYSESSKSDFPLDLKILCTYLAQTLNFPKFNAEAGIINMYHFGSTLSGHTDHSEKNLEAPLFSFSFGQSAIFLIGGHTLDERAVPILIESGDILIMSGESRLCYHGVPKILPADSQPWNEQLTDTLEHTYFVKEIKNKISVSKEWELFDSYVCESRINMNVRQVLFPGQEMLDT